MTHLEVNHYNITSFTPIRDFCLRISLFSTHWVAKRSNTSNLGFYRKSLGNWPGEISTCLTVWLPVWGGRRVEPSSANSKELLKLYFRHLIRLQGVVIMHRNHISFYLILPVKLHGMSYCRCSTVVHVCCC